MVALVSFMHINHHAINQKHLQAGVEKDTIADRLRKSLPAAGKLVNDKPTGNGWINMLTSPDNWNADSKCWSVGNGTLHGDYNGRQFHNYAWTKNAHKNFELSVLFKLDGKDPNSGVCIRIQPTDADNAPGYQVDMGVGYWGSLWEERRAGMVQQFPPQLAERLVKDKDWNHYYIIAKDHHI